MRVFALRIALENANDDDESVVDVAVNGKTERMPILAASVTDSGLVALLARRFQGHIHN